MSTLRELKDRIAKGEKVHIPNLAFYCALYDGELRCFNKNSNSKKPMELHLGMDEILSHKWGIYAVPNQNHLVAIVNAKNAIAKLTKMCITFPHCRDCPFHNPNAVCILNEITKPAPDMWFREFYARFGQFFEGEGSIE